MESKKELACMNVKRRGAAVAAALEISAGSKPIARKKKEKPAAVPPSVVYHGHVHLRVGLVQLFNATAYARIAPGFPTRKEAINDIREWTAHALLQILESVAVANDVQAAMRNDGLDGTRQLLTTWERYKAERPGDGTNFITTVLTVIDGKLQLDTDCVQLP